jgi:NTP pyrophosphatase (non-canonical NTP hydrolase)
MDSNVSYPEFVAAILKSGDTIKNELTPEQANLWHLATGVSGEAGELLDAIKKHVVYQKPLDTANVLEELGDLVFYIQGLMLAIGVDADTVINSNRAKLNRRYHTGTYSNQQAVSRADKDTADRDFVTR